MSFHTTDRDGITELNPSVEKMQEILETLQDDIPENPDVWLTHDSGWSVSFFPSGLAILENEELEAESKQLTDVSSDKALQLWQLLAQGKIDTLLEGNWEELED